MARQKSGPTEYLTGTVTRANDKGVQLDGDDTWYNVSRYSEDPPILPVKGTRVTIGIDDKNWLYTVKRAAAADDGEDEPPQKSPQRPQSGPPAGSSASDDREARISRMAVLNTAVAALSSGGREVLPTEAFSVATVLFKWVMGDAASPETGEALAKVEAVLAKRRPRAAEPTGTPAPAAAAAPAPAANPSRPATPGDPEHWSSRAATQPQLTAIYALGRGERALDDGAIEALSHTHFDAAVAELSRKQAAEFIDLLREGTASPAQGERKVAPDNAIAALQTAAANQGLDEEALIIQCGIQFGYGPDELTLDEINTAMRLVRQEWSKLAPAGGK